MKKTIIFQDFAILNVQHKFTLIQQKIWNFLISLICENINLLHDHEISIDCLNNYLNINDLKFIENKILKMHKTNFTKQEFCPDDLCYYFDEIKISKNKIYFKFPENLSLLIANAFTRHVLNLLVNTDFKSKYSLFLYEFCLYYKLFECDFDFVPMREFRKFMGLVPNQYSSFKFLYKKIILPALYEINSKTNLDVSIKFKKEAKSVIGLKLVILEKRRKIVNLQETREIKEINKQNKNDLFLRNIAYSRYSRLPRDFKKIIDQQYDFLIKNNQEDAYNNLNKINFLIEKCTTCYERYDI
ncbi:replication initiation protein [Candidatus Babeliales bacterium]|nr:replication initiation protein [Candidatus Babeliales bacterium]MCF7899809.1 replication initiation protein [Candidatus Babeliales bacterium]